MKGRGRRQVTASVPHCEKTLTGADAIQMSLRGSELPAEGLLSTLTGFTSAGTRFSLRRVRKVHHSWPSDGSGRVRCVDTWTGSCGCLRRVKVVEKVPTQFPPAPPPPKPHQPRLASLVPLRRCLLRTNANAVRRTTTDYIHFFRSFVEAH